MTDPVAEAFAVLVGGGLARRELDRGGRMLRWVEAGSGTPVVLEAGAMSPVVSYAAVFRELATDHRVIAYDRAGYGVSDPAPLSVELQVGDLVALLDEVGPAVLVGHSWGGLLAQLATWERPDLIRGLVLLDPSHESFWDNADPMPHPDRTKPPTTNPHHQELLEAAHELAADITRSISPPTNPATAGSDDNITTPPSDTGSAGSRSVGSGAAAGSGNAGCRSVGSDAAARAGNAGSAGSRSVGSGAAAGSGNAGCRSVGSDAAAGSGSVGAGELVGGVPVIGGLDLVGACLSYVETDEQLFTYLDELPMVLDSVGELRERRGRGTWTGLPVVLLTATKGRAVEWTPRVIAVQEQLAVECKGRHQVVPESGHYLQIDVPELVIACVREVGT
ncbi:alpha/beta fold hydrolase [Kribbella sp. GL6]|uniref:alpha/beta fold hydrolase n=1 Tax=Kribbella sp. GL6 TaxID=3419765 RepID=UPI003D00862D